MSQSYCEVDQARKDDGLFVDVRDDLLYRIRLNCFLKVMWIIPNLNMRENKISLSLDLLMIYLVFTLMLVYFTNFHRN